MSTIILQCFIFLTIYFQLIHGMIIGNCTEPNTWKQWLNVHRPTVLGLLSYFLFFSAFYNYFNF